jgi:propionyl-CoA carboxylase alpha chain
VIKRLLVANRAEIASRVFRTCRRLGIETVAVHSDADSGLPYVREADVAVRLPGSSPAETYLRGDLLVDAALRSGADAVHPGYGFLSENAAFARAVEDAGLTWVGPTPESIEAMGSKIRAKEIMRAAGVPVLEAPPVPTEGDFPLLVKASAGGGGRGMRVVCSLEELPWEIGLAEKEALSAFGDGTRRSSRRRPRRACPTRCDRRSTRPLAGQRTPSTTAGPAPWSSSTTRARRGSGSWR